MCKVTKILPSLVFHRGIIVFVPLLFLIICYAIKWALCGYEFSPLSGQQRKGEAVRVEALSVKGTDNLLQGQTSLVLMISPLYRRLDRLSYKAKWAILIQHGRSVLTMLTRKVSETPADLPAQPQVPLDTTWWYIINAPGMIISEITLSCFIDADR